MLPQAKKRLRRFQILVRGIPRLGLLVVNPKFQRFALTGCIAAVKVEADGGLHIALADATGDKPGIVVCEVPGKQQWCEIRTTVFGWTRTRFPLHIRSARKLTINQAPIVNVIGKAFFDLGDAPKDQLRLRLGECDDVAGNVIGTPEHAAT